MERTTVSGFTVVVDDVHCDMSTILAREWHFFNSFADDAPGFRQHTFSASLPPPLSSADDVVVVVVLGGAVVVVVVLGGAVVVWCSSTSSTGLVPGTTGCMHPFGAMTHVKQICERHGQGRGMF